MGAAEQEPLGLRIKTVGDPEYNALRGRLTRTSEVSVLSAVVAAAAPPIIREKGLKIGLLFRGRPRLVSLEFGVGVKNQQPPPLMSILNQDSEVTEELDDLLGEEGRWYGFKIAPFPGFPIPDPPESEALFFKMSVRRIRFANPQHFYVLPVITVLGDLSFDVHALGLSVLTVGNAGGANNFETSAVTVVPP